MRPASWLFARGLCAAGGVLLAVGVGITLLVAAALADGSSPPVLVARVEGVIDPVTAGYLHRVIGTAEQEGAALLVIALDTPGGLDTSMREMVQDLLNSSVPTVVFVSPSGARAASAGVFIAQAGHVVAMAPGTNIGAAHPVTGGGNTIPGDLRDKVTNDAAAYLAGIAKQRGRNDIWVQDAVRNSVSLDAQGAVDEHVADLLAPDLPTLLEGVDGRLVRTATGPVTIRSRDAPISRLDMHPVELASQKVFDPNVAYLLLTIGFYALVIELFHPGALVPGVTGVVCVVLAFVAFAALPMNWGGVLLILTALGLFILDIKAAAHGGLTIAGLVAFVLGSLLLYSPPGPRSPTLPDVAVAPGVLLAAAAAGALVGLVVIGTAVRLARRGPLSGVERLSGALGVTGSTLDPLGTVHVGGQVWSARLRSGTLGAGETVRVLARQGLTLEVEPAETTGTPRQREAPP
jgi:membrane-bound serine protease (ClpP class)